MGSNLPCEVETKNIESIAALHFDELEIHFKPSEDGKKLVIDIPERVTKTAGEKQFVVRCEMLNSCLCASKSNDDSIAKSNCDGFGIS